MRKIPFGYSILFLLLACLCQSQNDFRPGYIIRVQRDTLIGEVEFRTGKVNYTSCRFRIGDEIQTFTPREISGYGFLNDRFYTALVVRDTFVEVLVSGKLNLYKQDLSYYLQKEGQDLFKLEQREKVSTLQGGRLITVEDTRWKGIINLLVFDCIKTPNASKDLKFDEKSLTRFILRYNYCSGLAYVEYKADKPWSKINPGFTSGIMYSAVGVRSNFNYLDYLPDRYSSVDPFIGLALEMSSPRISERMAFVGEVLLTRQVFSEEYRLEIPSSIVDYQETVFHLNFLSVNYSLKYRLNARALSPFIQAGGAYDFFINSKTEHIKETVFVKEKEVSTSYINPFDFKWYQLGFWGAVGISRKWKDYILAARLKYGNNTLFSAHQEWHGYTNNFIFSLSCFFE